MAKRSRGAASLSSKQQTDKEKCAICLQAWDSQSEEDTTWLRCSHRFHRYCISTHAQILEKALEDISCPVCRTPVSEGAKMQSPALSPHEDAAPAPKRHRREGVNVLEVSEDAAPAPAPWRPRGAGYPQGSDARASSSSQDPRMEMFEGAGSGPHPLQHMAARAVDVRGEDGSDDLFCVDSLQGDAHGCTTGCIPDAAHGPRMVAGRGSHVGVHGGARGRRVVPRAARIPSAPSDASVA